MLTLSWLKCKGDVWCPFEGLNLSKISTSGVYVIWHGGDTPRTVYVGQGKVADRIQDHRGDEEITCYRGFGLYVTWAAVSAAQRDGVERYLADSLNPLIGDAHPNVVPIAVNSPWG